MAEKNNSKIEREYIVPLREKCRPVPRYKKTPKAVKSLKEFIAKHMKVKDRDLNKVRVDLHLNELLWARGIKKPLHKVKVKAVKEGDIVRVYAVDLTPKIKFKKERLERREVKGKEQAQQQKSMMEKAKEQLQGKSTEKEDKDKDGVDDKVEVKEKEESIEKTATVESKKDHSKSKKVKETKPEKDLGKDKSNTSPSKGH